MNIIRYLCNNKKKDNIKIYNKSIIHLSDDVITLIFEQLNLKNKYKLTYIFPFLKIYENIILRQYLAVRLIEDWFRVFYIPTKPAIILQKLLDIFYINKQISYFDLNKKVLSNDKKLYTINDVIRHQNNIYYYNLSTNFQFRSYNFLFVFTNIILSYKKELHNIWKIIHDKLKYIPTYEYDIKNYNKYKHEYCNKIWIEKITTNLKINTLISSYNQYHLITNIMIKIPKNTSYKKIHYEITNCGDIFFKIKLYYKYEDNNFIYLTGNTISIISSKDYHISIIIDDLIKFENGESIITYICFDKTNLDMEKDHILLYNNILLSSEFYYYNMNMSPKIIL